MKYLCLAYGAEADWKKLRKDEQDALLAEDEVIRSRGALMATVETDVVTVRAWNGVPEVTRDNFAQPQVPLAGFSVIEADSLEEVVDLVAKTPCARAKGAIEIRSIMAINDAQWCNGR
jgi:hypothetical protein